MQIVIEWIVLLFILGGALFAPRLLIGMVAGVAGLVFFGVTLAAIGAVILIGSIVVRILGG